MPNGHSSPTKAAAPDTINIGSIADRMRALRGQGMDVGNEPPKRLGKDVPLLPASSGSSASSGKPGPLGPMSVTGGAGNYGPARGSKREPSSEQPASVRTLPTRPTQPSPVVPTVLSALNLPTAPVSKAEDVKSWVGQTSTLASAEAIQGNVEKRPSPLASKMNDHTASTGPPQPPTPTIASPSSTGHGNTTKNVPATALKQSESVSRVSENQQSSSHPTETPRPPSRSQTLPPPKQKDDLNDFANAFPSLSEFGKQFETDEAFKSPTQSYPFEYARSPVTGLPNGRSHGTIRHDEFDGHPALSLPDVPTSLPSLPSAPSGMPGLPPPPSRPDNLSPSHQHILPPSPDSQVIARSASTPMTPVEHVSSPPPAGEAISRISSRQHTVPNPQPVNSPDVHHSPLLTFPVAVPTPKPKPAVNGTKPSAPPIAPKPKPKLPYTNAISPEQLRGYILDPELDVLILDVRPEDEYRRSYVGIEYEPRGAVVKIVWMDPTVLMRSE
jgi:ubiquitin carboxyl-terminal hydrolase 8